ncbi:MAG: class II aldolase/adducin family protein [Clostridia bacterium]|nr:class II aldolase/adducin family protein [Clostridia bacterium]
MGEKIKKQLVEIAQLMYTKNMVNAYEGNISFRKGNRVYITPSAVCKGFLKTEMIVVTDLEGNKIEGDYKASSEIKLHLAAYRMRNDIQGVVHAHTPYATAYALANKPIETNAYPELITLFGSVPLALYGTPSTDEIYQGIGQYIEEHDIILLANHGIMAVGCDAFDAFFKLEAAESIAKTLFLAEQMGGAKPLPQNKLQELYDIKKSAKKS